MAEIIELTNEPMLLFFLATDKQEAGKYLLSNEYIDRALDFVYEKDNLLKSMLLLKKASNYSRMMLFDLAIEIYFCMLNKKDKELKEEVYLNLIDCFVCLKRYDEAFYYLGQGIKYDIIDEENVINLFEQFDEPKLRMFDAKDHKELLNLGKFYISNIETHEKGKEILENIYPSSNQYFEANFNLALDAFCSAQYSNAKEYLDKLCENGNDNKVIENIKNPYVVLLSNLNEYKMKGSINRNELVKIINDTEVTVQNGLLIMTTLCCVGEHRFAEQWAEKAINVMPYSIPLLLLALQANYNCGNHVKALEKVSTLIRIDKRNYEAKRFYDLIIQKGKAVFPYNLGLPDDEYDLILYKIGNILKKNKRVLNQDERDIIIWLFSKENYLTNNKKNFDLIIRLTNHLMQFEEYKSLFANSILVVDFPLFLKREIIFSYIRHYDQKTYTFSMLNMVKTIRPNVPMEWAKFGKIFCNAYIFAYYTISYRNIKKEKILKQRIIRMLSNFDESKKDCIKDDISLTAIMFYKLIDIACFNSKESCCIFFGCDANTFEEYYKFFDMDLFND